VLLEDELVLAPGLALVHIDLKVLPLVASQELKVVFTLLKVVDLDVVVAGLFISRVQQLNLVEVVVD
jgi:hypothetical protein